MKVADNKCVLVSNFDVKSLAHMVVLWGNMNTPAGPMNLSAKYARCHLNTPLVCRRVEIYTPITDPMSTFQQEKVLWLMAQKQIVDT